MGRLFVLTILLAAPTRADERSDLLARLGSEGFADRQVAYDDLEGPARAFLPAALTELARLRARDVQQHGALLDEILAVLPLTGGPRRATYAAAAARWNAARAKAMAAVMDPEKFPSPPPNTVIRGPFTGASGVKSALGAAESAYKAVDEPARLALERLGAGADQEARLARIASLAELAAERGAVLERHGRKVPALRAVELGLAHRAAALAQGRPDVALREVEALDEVDRVLLFALFGRHLSARAQTRAAEISPDTQAALGRLDQLRLAIGAWPLEPSPHLTASVSSHVSDMRDRRYFSHDSPDPARRRPHDRAKLAGWTGKMTGENLSASGPIDALMVWGWDGAHARIMLDPEWEWIGFASVSFSPAQRAAERAEGFCGINVGKAGPPTSWPRPALLRSP